MEIKGVVQTIAGNRRGFIITGSEGWFNVDDKLLVGFNKGDSVIVTYELNGKQKKAYMVATDGPKTDVIVGPETKKEPITEVKNEIVKDSPAVKYKEHQKSSTGFVCSVCGKELKDGKFKKCYDCNVAAKATPKTEENVPTTSTATPCSPKCVDCGVVLKDNKYQKCFPCNQKNTVKKQWKPKSGGYDSPEKQAAIVKGNSLNAAAAVLCGASCLDGLDPEGIAQVTKIVANSLMDYLKQD